MRGKRKVLDFFPVTTAKAVFIDGTDKTVYDKISGINNINNSMLITSRKYADVISTVKINTTDWTNVDGDIEESEIIDKVNDYSILKAVKFISKNNGRITASLTTPVDGSIHPVLVQIYMDEEEDINNMLTTKLEFYSDGVFDANHRASTFIQYAEGNSEYTRDFSRNGLFYLCQIPVEILKEKGAQFNINNITGIGFHVLHTNGSTRTIRIANVSFVNPLKIGGCVTIVDNFNIAVPEMCDYAYSKGVKLNISIIPNSIDGDNEILSASKEALEKVKRQGHTIINHTNNHSEFNSLTEIEINNEIINAENWMEVNNYIKGSRIISVPSARFNTLSYNSAISTNAQGIYHMWTNTANDTTLNKILYPYYPTTRLIDTSSLDKCEEAITLCQKAVEYKGIVVNGYHGDFWTKDNGESWKKYIDAISQIPNLRHYGIDEILEGKFI